MNWKATAVLTGLTTAAWALPMGAQQMRGISGLMDGMPPAARTTLEALEHLNQVEIGPWHYHAGDLPHGEAVSLDDTSWQTVNPGSEAPAEAAWYRTVFEVPKSLHGYDMTGTTITFRFEAEADGDVPEIVYLNGRRVALGADLEPIALTADAKPGERFVIAVKLLATPGTKRFRRAMLHVEYADNRPSPSDFLQEALSAQILIPSLSKDPSSDKATLEKAIAAVDLKALDAGNQSRFDASLRAAEQAMEPLKPTLQQATFHETGNSHIDAAWLWPWTETVDVVHRTFGTAAQLLEEYPQYTYTQSAAQYNEWMADKYPDLNDLIKKDIKAGRWEVVGGMWVEPDLNLPGGEATVRSILIGKRYYMKEYGVDVKIGWNPDSFGYNWQLPQIYSRSGIDTFVTQKMSWNDTNQLPLKLFWWESPDGSKVLTYFPHGYGNQSMSPVRLSMDFATARKQAPGLNEMMDLYGVGDHGGGPTRAMLDEGMHWAKNDKVTPKYDFSIAGTYFDKMRGEIAPDSKTWDYKTIAAGYTYPAAPPDGQVSIPTWDDELYLEYHRGVYTTQAMQKWNLRHSEVEALDAEKVASLAWLDGNAYPGDRLTQDWKYVTFNDFHDLAAGSGIAVIYRDAQKQFNVIREDTDDIAQTAMKTLDARVDTAGGAGVPVLVWNPLAWERTGPVTVSVQMPKAASSVYVEDSKGMVVPSHVTQANAATQTFLLEIEAPHIPAMGYTVLHVMPGEKRFASDLKADGLTLENSDLKLTVDKQTGCIISLYDKRDSFETLASGGCGNELQAFADNPKDYDAWNIDPGTLDVPPTKIDTADSVELVEHNDLRDVIRVQRHWQGSTFTQNISLAAGEDHAVISNDFDWHASHILLKASFPLAASSANATFEIPYGAIERPTTRNNSFEKARFEVPALKWADEGDGQHGFSLINDSKYGYDAVGNQLRLSLLRSPKSPDPNADMGMQHFSYALYPHSGDWKQALTVQHGYDFNYPLQAMQEAPHAGALPASFSYLSVSSPTVILTAMKKAEDSNALIVRMYESAGKPESFKLKLPQGATGVERTNLMESAQDGTVPLSDGVASVDIKPWEILTLKVNYNH